LCHHEYFLSESYDLDEDYRAMLAGDFERTGMVITHYTAVDPGCAPPGHSVLAMMSLAPWDYGDVWGTGGNTEGYGENPEYLRIKEAAADALVARAERLIPGLTESIVVREVGTPLTNYRYGLNPSGSIYGREQTVANVMDRRSARTTVPNLFLAGAWVAGGGMSAAIGSGKSAAKAANGFLAER
jgi:prolycopene isomerase